MKSLTKTATGSGVQGYLVASILRGCWRKVAPPTDIDAETLARILPLLTMGGVAALAWRRMRMTPLESSPAAQPLREIHRFDVLRNAVHERSLKRAIALLDAEGIESVLVKGWSLGPLYPEPGLRMFGDIDLCIRPRDYDAAKKALATCPELDVDLHSGFDKFYETRTEEIFSRSELRDLEGTEVRVPRFEDHFRFLCLHLLRHGANRPLWLCDIAAALESMDDRFDWDLCLGDKPRHAELVVGAIGIANALLDARIEDLPVASKAIANPGWMATTVLSEWSIRFSLPSQLASHIRQPIALLRNLPRHWPNAIEATINLGGRINERPRWPLQIGDVVAKTLGFLTGSRRVVRAIV